MTPFSHIQFLFFLVQILSNLIRVSNALGGNDDTLGELGRLRLTRFSEEEELEDVCKCLQGNGYCINTLQKYGPIIQQGICYGNLSTRNKRRAKRSDAAFSSPPTFIENKKCRGTKTIILASSGKERQLTLTTPASVFICKGSIDANLQQLFVTGVAKIVIAPGALQERDSDLEIRFSSLEDKIVIPEGAFSLQITIQGQSRATPDIEVEHTPLLPPKIKLEIDKANEIEFKSRSIVAPMVHVKLTQIKKVTFGSNSIIPYAHPEASALEISHSHSVTLDKQTINTGKYEAKNIKHLFMKEQAVEVVGDDGAVAKIEYVSNITLLDEALRIGSGADILLNNLTFTSAGVRAIQGTGPGYLRRAAFTYVTGKQFESVAMCIKAETAVVYNVEIRGNNESLVGACIEGQIIHEDKKHDDTVRCAKVEGSILLCNNTVCSPCGPESKVNITSEPATTTLISSTTEIVSAMTVFFNTTTGKITSDMTSTGYGNKTSVLLLGVTFNTPSYPEDYDYLGEGKPQTDLLPLYIIIICLCGAIILSIFIIYMIYRCCTHNKHYKYYLPRENRMTSFHNPRTITTPENLTRHINTIPRNHENSPPQVYTTYDAHRQPTVTYAPVAEPIAIANSPEVEEHLQNSPPPAYEILDSHSQGMPPQGYNNNRASPENSYHHNDMNYLPPPPEGYCYPNDDQTQISRISLSSERSSSTEDSTSSEEELSPAQSYIPTPNDNLHTVDEKLSDEQEKAFNNDSKSPDEQNSVENNQHGCESKENDRDEEAQFLDDEMII